MTEANDIVKIACEAAEDKKGTDIAVLDINNSAVADYFILVNGTSPPHLKALSGEIEHALKQQGHRCYRRAGVPEGGWLVLDYVDVVIHIFSPDARKYYAVEDLWKKGPVEHP